MLQWRRWRGTSTAVVVDDYIICVLMCNEQLGYDTIIGADKFNNVFVEQTPLDVIDAIENNTMCCTLLGCEKDFLNNTHNKFTIKCNFSLSVVLSHRSSRCLFFHSNDEHGIFMTVICTNICFISIHNKMVGEFFQLFEMTTHNTITPLAWNKKRCLLFLLYFCQSIYYSLYFFLFLSFSYSFFYSFSFPLILFFMNRLFLIVICANKWECAFQYFVEKNTGYRCT